MTLKAIIHEAEEGGYWAEVPALPGCVTQGDSVDEVTSNLREAIEGWLSVETPEAPAADTDRVIELAL
jgi:predicted RNase H-like HicB family nuclease